MSVFESLAKDIRLGRCLPFIGAGVSAWRECRYPLALDWRHLVDELARAEGDQRVGRSPIAKAASAAHAAGMFTETPQLGSDMSPQFWRWEGAPPTWFLRLCMLALLEIDERLPASNLELSTLSQRLHRDSPVELAHIMLRLFFCERGTGHRNMLLPTEPNSLHRSLSLFPFETIVTTNFDCCFEVARKAVNAEIIALCNDIRFRRDGIYGPRLFKIHGEFSQPQHRQFLEPEDARDFLNAVVLTDRHYWDFPHGRGAYHDEDAYGRNVSLRRLMVDYIRTLMLTHRVLFLGYSLSDFNIVELLHGLAGFQREANRPVLVTSDNHKNEAQQALWESRGVHVEAGRELDGFVEELWGHLYQGISTEQVQAIKTPFRRDLRLFIPVAALRREAAKNHDFGKVLRRVIKSRCFPIVVHAGSDTMRLARWPASLFDSFSHERWIRPVRKRSDVGSIPLDLTDADFWEFSPEVRQVIVESFI